MPPVAPTTARSTGIVILPLAVFNVETGTTFPVFRGLPLGGLSACLREAPGETLAVSDSTEVPLLYQLGVSWDGTSLRVTPTAATRMATGGAGAPSRVDLEGIADSAHDTFIVSTEGVNRGESQPRDLPSLLEYGRDGRYIMALPLPPAYQPSAGRPAHGLRHNAAFEALTAVGDSRLLVGTEHPLAQDDEPPGIGRGGWGRLLEFAWDATRGWQPSREFAYPIDPVPSPPGFRAKRAETGLVELLQVGPDRFVAMERSFVEPETSSPPPYNVVRLYDVSLRDAEDITGRRSIGDGGPPRPVSKALIADLDDWRTALGPGLATLDNFEALCDGPRAADGGRTVLIISDNNFNRRQRTAFVLASLVVRE